MKKLTFSLLFLFLPLTAFAQGSADVLWYANNQGSDSYEISTVEQLRGLAELVNGNVENFADKTIMLTADIELTGNWTPIGSGSELFFAGTFDGQGKTISGLSVNGVTYAGLFGYVGAEGQVKNINIVGTKIKGTRYAGGLVGYYASAKTIENATVKADSIIVTSTSSSYFSYSGGLVGYA